MPPPVPSRYRLEIRLGRDQDIEEWLATDLSLERPVLIRVVGPEATLQRQADFLEMVRNASRVSHIHLSDIYGAKQSDGSAYSVTEWTGGVTLADRITAGETPSIAEFLSNAAGLADGLAALHEEGIIHGAINASAVGYIGAHPAKLGGFGRRPQTHTMPADIQALGSILETALTGRESGVLAPSQVIDGLPEAVDDVLHQAQKGELTARRLAQRLRSIPYTPPPPPPARLSWRWVIPALALTVITGALLWLGSLLGSETDPITLEPLDPVILAPASTLALVSTTPTTTLPDAPPVSLPAVTPPFQVQEILVYDPLGDERELTSRLNNLIDDDLTTSWRTERYFDPLPLLKEGVGVVFAVAGIPQGVEFVGMTAGTAFQLLWSEQVRETPQEWEIVAGGRSFQEDTIIQLPQRQAGFWLMWLIELPVTEDGFVTQVAEVRFR